MNLFEAVAAHAAALKAEGKRVLFVAEKRAALGLPPVVGS